MSSTTSPPLAVVEILQDFKPVEDICLALKKGQVVLVLRTDPSGWWYGTCGAKSGWYPSNFGRPLSVDSLQKLVKMDTQSILNGRNNNPSQGSSSQGPEGRPGKFENSEKLRKNKAALVVATSIPPAQNDVEDKSRSETPLPFSVFPPHLVENINVTLSTLASQSTSLEEKWGAIRELIQNIRFFLSHCGVLAQDSPTLKQNLHLSQIRGDMFTALRAVVRTCNDVLSDEPPNGANMKLRLQVEQLRQSLDWFMELMISHISSSRKDSGSSTASTSLSLPSQRRAIASPAQLRNFNDASLQSHLSECEQTIRSSVTRLLQFLTKYSSDTDLLLKMITEILNKTGVLLLFIEDLKIPTVEEFEKIDCPSISKDEIADFHDLKETVYNNLNDLIIVARTNADQLTLNNETQSLISIVRVVSKTCQDMIIMTKKLIPLQPLLNCSGQLSGSRTPIISPTQAGEMLSPLDSPGPTLNRSQFSSQSTLKTQDSTTVVSTSTATSSIGSIRERRPSEKPNNNALDIIIGHFRSKFTKYTARAILNGTVGPLPLEMRALMAKEHKYPSTSSFAESIKESSATSTPNLINNPKIYKLLGEETRHMNLPTATEQFLKRDYSNGDVDHDKEERVLGATWPALVELLTLHDKTIDGSFMHAFMLTFRCFSTPMQLFEELRNRFMIKPPPGLNDEELQRWREEKQAPIRFRVFNAFKSWLESYYYEGVDDEMLAPLQKFIEEFMISALSSSGTRLLALVNKKLGYSVTPLMTPLSSVTLGKNFGRFPHEAETPSPSEGSSLPAPIITKQLISTLRLRQPVSLTDIDPLELARQLTIMDSRILCEITPFELIGQEWSKPSGKAINVKAMSAFTVKITTWTAEAILFEPDVKKRANILKHFIKLAEKCFQLSNFNTLIAILCAINSSTIDRLWKTWELVPNRFRVILSALRQATDHRRNYGNYRKLLRECQPPCIPFFGLMLTDLVFTDDGNPNFRRPLAAAVSAAHSNVKIINFDKYRKMVDMITALQKFQKPFALAEVGEIQDWVREQLESLRSDENTKMLYEQSFRIEPKIETPAEMVNLHRKSSISSLS